MSRRNARGQIVLATSADNEDQWNLRSEAEMSATHDADLSAAEIIVRRTYRDWKIAECKHELAKFHKNIFLKHILETHFKKQEKESATEVHHNVDLVKGKGTGVIILLHGAPGVGKTSTAECVAEHTGRPLFSITCGDIGDTAETVEKNLDRCFQMAHKWGCVLLLDEADVFMARRDKIDLRRNALVSVFLRVLEYYAGILFLTTNRVGTFDAAFKSRIHLSLGYPPLDYESTKKIWKMNIERTRVFFDGKLDIERDEILKFMKSHFKKMIGAGDDVNYANSWNGRQIRNAFQTAIALAQWKAVKANSTKPAVLGSEQFEQVAQASSDFDSYLLEVHNDQSEGELAFLDTERADKFFTPKPDIKARNQNNRTRNSREEPRTSRTGKTTKKVRDAPSKMMVKYGSESEEEEDRSDESDSRTSGRTE